MTNREKVIQESQRIAEMAAQIAAAAGRHFCLPVDEEVEFEDDLRDAAKVLARLRVRMRIALNAVQGMDMDLDEWMDAVK